MTRWISILELADSRAILADSNEEPLAGIVFESTADAIAFIAWTGDDGHNYRFASERSRRQQTTQYSRERHWPVCASGGCCMRVDSGPLCDGCVAEADIVDRGRDAVAMSGGAL